MSTLHHISSSSSFNFTLTLIIEQRGNKTYWGGYCFNFIHDGAPNIWNRCNCKVLYVISAWFEQHEMFTSTKPEGVWCKSQVAYNQRADSQRGTNLLSSIHPKSEQIGGDCLLNKTKLSEKVRKLWQKCVNGKKYHSQQKCANDDISPSICKVYKTKYWEVWIKVR